MSAHQHIGIRVSGPEKQALQDAADKARLPLSTWMKLICLSACGAMDYEDVIKQVEQAKKTQSGARERDPSEARSRAPSSPRKPCAR